MTDGLPHQDPGLNRVEQVPGGKDAGQTEGQGPTPGPPRGRAASGGACFPACPVTASSGQEAFENMLLWLGPSAPALQCGALEGGCQRISTGAPRPQGTGQIETKRVVVWAADLDRGAQAADKLEGTHQSWELTPRALRPRDRPPRQVLPEVTEWAEVSGR